MTIGFTCASSVFAIMYYVIVSKYDFKGTLIEKYWTLLKFEDNLIAKLKQAVHISEDNDKAKKH